MSQQKKNAIALDAAAQRCSYGGASSKQCWFLAKLMAEAGQTPEDNGLGLVHTTATLTSKQASSLISSFIGN